MVAMLFGGMPACSDFMWGQDCYRQNTVRDRLTGDVVFDDGLTKYASGPFDVDEIDPTSDGGSGSVFVRPSPSDWVPDSVGFEIGHATALIDGPRATFALLRLKVGTYDLATLGVTLTLCRMDPPVPSGPSTPSPPDPDAGWTSCTDAILEGTLVVHAASTTDCASAWVDHQIGQVCVRALKFDLTIEPSPAYAIYGTISFDYATNLVVTSHAWSCID